MLTSTNEDNGTLSRSDGREGSSSLSVAIQLSHDDGTDWDLRLELSGLIVNPLTIGGGHDEDNIVGNDGILNLLHLVEEGGLLLVATRGIYDNQVILLSTKLADSLAGNGDGIALGEASVEAYLGLSSVLLELVLGTSTEGIGADKSDL